MIINLWNKATSAIKRNKRSIVIASGTTILSAGLYAYYKFKPLYDRIRSELAMLERMTKDMSRDNNNDQQSLVNRLNQNLIIADLTLRQWMINMRNALIVRFDVEGVRASIKRGASSQEDMDKWNQFKVQGFARTLSALYISCILNALLKIQLAIVARYVQAESASNNDKPAASNSSESSIALPAPSPLGSLVTEECNRTFVAFAAHAQEHGLHQIEESAIISIQHELDKWQLGALCSFDDIKQTLTNIRSAIESTCQQASRDVDVDVKLSPITSHFRTIMLPRYADIKSALESQRSVISDVSARSITLGSSQGGIDDVTQSTLTDRAMTRLDAMTAEVCSILDTQAFHQTLESSLDDAFNALLDTIHPAFATNVSSSTSNSSSSNQSIPFAAVMVRIMKAFDTLVPSKADEESLLFDSLSNNAQARDLAATIFLPLDERGLNVTQTCAISPNNEDSLTRISSGQQVQIEEIDDAGVPC